MIRTVKDSTPYESGIDITPELPSVKTRSIRSDLVDKLVGYTSHSLACLQADLRRVRPKRSEVVEDFVCTCGLSNLIHEIRGE